MASIAGIVFNLEGPRALSDFREERLLRALEKVNSAVEAVSSRFIHFVHAEKELDAASPAGTSQLRSHAVQGS